MPGGRSRHTMLPAAVLAALTLMAGCGSSGNGPTAQPPAAPVSPIGSPSVSPPASPTQTPSRPPTPSPTASPSTPTSAPSASAAKTYFPQYGTSTHAYKPGRLEPSVDGSLSVGRVHWHVWNSRSAVGHGVAHINDCKPDCADGHFTAHPVTVFLSRPRELCGSTFFTAIRLSGPDYRTRSRWSGIGCA